MDRPCWLSNDRMNVPSFVMLGDIVADKTNLRRESLPKKSLAALENFVALRKPDENTAYLRYSEEYGNMICEAVAQGHSIQEIAQHVDTPSERTIYEWIRTYPAMFLSYQQARERYADRLMDEAVKIADDDLKNFKEDSKGRLVPDWENVNRAKLRVETRKWMASKFAPKKYGDKIEITGEMTLSLGHETRESKLIRMREIAEEFRRRGGDMKALFAALGLQDVAEVKELSSGLDTH